MKSFLMVIVALSSTFLWASETVPFDSDRWQFSAKNHRIEEHLETQSLYLIGGTALVNDAQFLNGIIEYDVAFSEVRGFAGAVWRVQDQMNFEQFYMRPHQSGNVDANQYTPCFNGLTAWQLYHGEGYGAAVTYPFDQWIPVKIVVSGDQAEVFVGKMDAPVLFVDELKREPATGKIGLSVANFGPAHFSNFRYKAVDDPKFVAPVDRKRSAKPGTVMKWDISDSFSEDALSDYFALPQEMLRELEWEILECESSGLANISELRTLGPQNDTVLARVQVETKDAHEAILNFGYSDRARLYLNGRLIYSGDNGYRSRDYRFLGTIGYFDSVNLPLKKGSNEVVIAVSESFGGWGLQASFDNADDLDLRP